MNSRIHDQRVPEIIKNYSKQLGKFASLLRSDQGTKENIQSTWDKMPNDVKILFVGGTITLNSTYSLIIRLATFKQWRENLSHALRWSLVNIAEMMIKTNKEYAAVFHGTQNINVGTTAEPIIINNTSFELLRNFDAVLSSRSQKIIDWYYKDNAELCSALTNLNAEKLQDYIDTAENAGYRLLVENEQVSFTLTKKRKAEDELKPDNAKRANTNESSTPDNVKRYFFRNGSGSQLSHFASRPVSSASLISESSSKSKVTSNQPSGSF